MNFANPKVFVHTSQGKFMGLPTNSSAYTSIGMIDRNYLSQTWEFTDPRPTSLRDNFQLLAHPFGWVIGWLLAATSGRIIVSAGFKVLPYEPPKIHLSVFFFTIFCCIPPDTHNIIYACFTKSRALSRGGGYLWLLSSWIFSRGGVVIFPESPTKKYGIKEWYGL